MNQKNSAFQLISSNFDFSFVSVALVVSFILGLFCSVNGQLSVPQRSMLKEVLVEKIEIKGVHTIDIQRIKKTLQVIEGKAYLPNALKLKIRNSIKELHELGWFSDISVEVDYPVNTEGVSFTFYIKELPVLGTTQIKGNRLLSEEDIREVIELIDGQRFSPSDVSRDKENILALYRDEGYLLADVSIHQKENTKTGAIDVTFKINEGARVKIMDIVLEGNESLKSSKIRRKMTTKKKSWFFGMGGEFKEDEFRESLDSITMLYQEKGYLDARVISHNIKYMPDKKFMKVFIKLKEGPKYHFGKADFIHNDILPDKALKGQIMLDSNEAANIKKVEAQKFKIEMLFRDMGHLFVQVREERKYKGTTLNVSYLVKEGPIAHINKVHVRGNTKTKDKVIRRELRIFPGDIFNQSLVMRSQREVMQLNFFDNVMPNYEKAGEDDVDLVFEVQEKEAGTGTFSAGAAYSGREELVGTIGLQIPNFLGNGQRANLNLEYGRLKKLTSIGFTEPWFMDTPTQVGGSLYWKEYDNIWHEKSNPAYGYEDFIEYGFTMNLGRRLTWPDDYFWISSTYNLSQNDNGRYRDETDLLQNSGLASSIGLTVIRDDKDLPMFPTDGSRYEFSYRKYGGLLGGNFDFFRFQTKVEYWFPIAYKLVLGIESEFGIISGDKIQQWSLYRMGGLLGYDGKLRGYNEGAVGRDIIGRSFFSFVTDLTYPIAQNVFYIQAFYDIGNVFGNVQLESNPKKGTLGSPVNDIDFSDLLSDYGVGFRLVIPMVGIMGFDFAWNVGSDFRDGKRISKKGVKTNFVIEAPF